MATPSNHRVPGEHVHDDGSGTAVVIVVDDDTQDDNDEGDGYDEGGEGSEVEVDVLGDNERKEGDEAGADFLAAVNPGGSATLHWRWGLRLPSAACPPRPSPVAGRAPPRSQRLAAFWLSCAAPGATRSRLTPRLWPPTPRPWRRLVPCRW